MVSQAILNQLQRAQDLYNAGQATDAWNIMAPLRSAIDDHGQALRLHALVARSVEDFHAAAEALIRLLALENEPPEIIGELGQTLIKQWKPSIERDLLAKANAAILKAGEQKEVRVSLSKLLKSAK